MTVINPKTVEKALRKIDTYAMEDGDIGGAEWQEVAQLLREAVEMQARIDVLEEEVIQLQVRLRRLPG
jgi:hypothetical protein